jgi:hypothetical protein
MNHALPPHARPSPRQEPESTFRRRHHDDDVPF